MSYYFSPLGNTQFFDANGAPLVGGTLETFLAGTSTPKTTYTSNTGGTAQGVVMTLNSLGLPTNGNVWIQGGIALKFRLKDASGTILYTWDNVLGIGDTTAVVDEYVQYSAAPTYIGANSFSVAGDQTNTFQVGRRIRSTNSGGTSYGTVATSTFAATVTTVVLTNTSGTLDSGLSAVYYGILAPTNSSIPANYAQATVIGAAKNLRSSANGTSANISITADDLVVETTGNVYLTLRTVSLTLVCSGSGANGLDTGALAASTIYHKWVIYNPATATTAALLSLSSTAPTMPSGYTYKARVGAISTDGTANKYPLGHVSFGADTDYVVKAGTNVTNRFGLVAGVQGNPATPTWVAVSLTAYVPSTACRVRGNAGCGGGANVTMSVAPNDQYGAASGTSNPPPLAMNTTNTGMSLPYDFAIESTNIYYNCNNANGYLLLGGWRDTI